jgi:hypothetical protein
MIDYLCSRLVNHFAGQHDKLSTWNLIEKENYSRNISMK